jgi:hypothetical protein
LLITRSYEKFEHTAGAHCPLALFDGILLAIAGLGDLAKIAFGRDIQPGPAILGSRPEGAG